MGSGSESKTLPSSLIRRLTIPEKGLWRILPDGRSLSLTRQIFNWKLGVSPTRDCGFYDSTWEYLDFDHAFTAYMTWDGDEEPEGWYRHPMSGRRRPEGDPTKEFQRW